MWRRRPVAVLVGLYPRPLPKLCTFLMLLSGRAGTDTGDVGFDAGRCHACVRGKGSLEEEVRVQAVLGELLCVAGSVMLAVAECIQ
jgi:hypothetical protein